uniref:Uncharacterized protein n=1 Tax=Alexandrium catenella TaxID=2925 RepID=A0A7S1PYM6_ALECA|mmetsp:Transcript_117501/g.312566  ORF Transcript_117501/g.312566 Transcript_117501/m.312566 type:complete len:110 (+) Transcript_117501:60-389(+)
MAITAEQFATTLENMTRAWEAVPEAERLPKDEERSFFDGCKGACLEMVQRWHGGESSHPDRLELASEYANSDEGMKKLIDDLFKIRDDPFVQAADLKLRLIKYTAPPRD